MCVGGGGDFTCVCVHVYACVYTCVCMHVCTRVCVCMCVCACGYVFEHTRLIIAYLEVFVTLVIVSEHLNVLL